MLETLADKLNRLLEDENADKEIRKVSPDIYRQIASHIKTIRSESSDRDRNLISAISLAEREILKDIASRLMELRVSKFIRDPDGDMSNLTLEERYVVEPLIQSRKREEKLQQAILNGHIGQLEQASNAIKQKFVIARFLQPYSAITGTDLATYGPFEPEDVAVLPLENAKHLSKIGIISPSWIEPAEG